MELSALIVCTILVAVGNALCSWNRAIDASAVGDDFAKTLNFINGPWERDTSQSSGNTFNGQQYWKQTNYDGCYVTTLWLYYHKGVNDGDYQWLISANFGVTSSSAYVRCNLDMPQPTNPVECNGNWLFAPNGTPSSVLANYVLDSDFYIKDGDCPQVTCSTLEFYSDANDIYAGTYTRESTNDQNNINIYRQSNTNSATGEYFLYFNQDTFSWLINDEYDTDCERADGGQVTAATDVGKWPAVSATDGNYWSFIETDANLETRLIQCGGLIPTTTPSASDATGYPTPSPVPAVDCTKVPSWPSCQPTQSSNTPSPVVAASATPTSSPEIQSNPQTSEPTGNPVVTSIQTTTAVTNAPSISVIIDTTTDMTDSPSIMLTGDPSESPSGNPTVAVVTDSPVMAGTNSPSEAPIIEATQDNTSAASGKLYGSVLSIMLIVSWSLFCIN